MAHAVQLAEWDRAAELIYRFQNAWFTEKITLKEANPLRNEVSRDLRSIKAHFRQRSDKAQPMPMSPTTKRKATRGIRSN